MAVGEKQSNSIIKTPEFELNPLFGRFLFMSLVLLQN